MHPQESEKLIQKINQALLSDDPERIYLFGSPARGEADDLSDVDLVIIKQTTEPFWDRLREVTRLFSRTICFSSSLAATGSSCSLASTHDAYYIVKHENDYGCNPP
jgi:predicted nucleotidyltransferase